MSYFGTADRLIAKALFAAPDGLVEIYALHRDYALSAVQVARSIKRFRILGVVIFEGRTLRLTEAGRLWIYQHSGRLFSDVGTLPWKKIPKPYLRKSGDSSFTPTRMNVERSLLR